MLTFGYRYYQSNVILKPSCPSCDPFETYEGKTNLRILVTGGAGYIGSTLVPLLISQGHQVAVLDRFFFGKASLRGPGQGLIDPANLVVYQDDVRWFDGSKFKELDAVVDMAALSNDPVGELDPWKTIDINYLGRSRIARLAREAGVRRYILISSCSIYGFQEGWLTEDSLPNPLTTYARANLLAERDNLSLATTDFTPTVLRFATIYGLSKRMRFDLAVNGMVLNGKTKGRIPVMRDGTQWRPFLYVGDAARAILTVLTSDRSQVGKQIFNIGSDDQKYQIRDLADLVRRSLSNKPSLEWYGDPDTRSYKVSFKKAADILKFNVMTTPEIATKEIESAIEAGKVADAPETNTLKWYRHLLDNEEAGRQVALRGVIL
jgi:nucleoside-diphosphate-sugar epimerase